MRTAIFVYQNTSINISTSESDLELCSMDADTISLSAGDNALTIGPGVYKIVSYLDVQVSGHALAFDFVTTSNKDDPPTPPPSLTTKYPEPLDMSALQAFLAVPDAKDLANP